MRWLLTPTEGEPMVYDDLALTLGETFELKRLAGLSLADLQSGFLGQDPEAWRFVYYLAMKRAGRDPGPYSEIDFAWRDLTIEPIVEEDPGAEESPDPDLPTGSTPDPVTTTGDVIPSP